MLFISVEDFLTKTAGIPQLSRAEEKALAEQMAAGDRAARETIVRSHLPLAASVIQRAPADIRTLDTVYACIAAVENAVDSFNFQQEGETFVHHLSWSRRQCITGCIANRP